MCALYWKIGFAFCGHACAGIWRPCWSDMAPVPALYAGNWNSRPVCDSWHQAAFGPARSLASRHHAGDVHASKAHHHFAILVIPLPISRLQLLTQLRVLCPWNTVGLLGQRFPGICATALCTTSSRWGMKALFFTVNLPAFDASLGDCNKILKVPCSDLWAKGGGGGVTLP